MSPDEPESPASLVALLEARARTTPDALAYVVLGDGERETDRVSYGELARRVRGVARVLSAAAPGERALLVYPPGLDYVTGLFGCWAAGLVAVPAYPPEPRRLERTLPRLLAIANDAGARLALTITAALPLLQAAGALEPALGALTWVATDAAPSTPAEDEPLGRLLHGGLALLQYTSGSTGTPRGVMLGHEELLANSAMIGHRFEHHDKTLSVTWLPPFHDMGLVGGILQPLYQGFPVVLMSPESFLERPMRWLRAIARYRATVSGGPNFAYELCVRKSTPEEREQLDLRSWELAFSGAEPVQADTLERFVAAFAGAGFRREAFYPCYGLAEATLIVSGGQKNEAPVVRRFDKQALARGQARDASTEQEGIALVGSGHAMPGLSVLTVRPETHESCAEGEVGEIWVRGASVARGYWGRPEETMATFGARLSSGEGPFLRTGDLGFVQHGELFVTGRQKDLIILRGQNHYPQDLERTIEALGGGLRQGCGAAFSVEVDDSEGEERLVLVWEFAGELGEADALVGQMREALAREHELQAGAIVLIEPRTVPKTSSGKIQRNACRTAHLAGELSVRHAWQARARASGESRPEREGTGKPDGGEGALGWLRERVAQLGGFSIAETDVTRSLVWHGLDSIRTVELGHAIERTWGFRIAPAELLGNASLLSLARRLEAEAEMERARLAEEPVSPTSVAAFPLSASQRAIWFLLQVAPSSRAFHLARALRLRGRVDATRLQSAIVELVKRHAALRARVTVVDGEPVQRVTEEAEVEIAVERLEDEPALHERLAREAARSFDLARGPLVRALLLVGDEQGVLLLATHHIVCDLWSLELLLGEISALHAGEAPGPVRGSYEDHVRREATHRGSPEASRSWEYFRAELSGMPPSPDLPTDRPRSGVPGAEGASFRMRLGKELSDRVRAQARAFEVTPLGVLLGAFAATLGRHTGQDDLVVGLPTAGRTSADLAEVVGCFVNPLPLRVQMGDDPSFAEQLRRVQGRIWGLLSHQALPLEVLVERLRPTRDPSRPELYSVLVTMQSPHRSRDTGLAALGLGLDGVPLDFGGLEAETLAVEVGAAQLDLSLLLGEVEGELWASFEYAAALFDEVTIARIGRTFRCLLEAGLSQPEARLSQLSLADEAELRAVLERGRGPAAPLRERTLTEIFRTQVAHRPNALALRDDEGALDYRELGRRASRLARALRRRGVGRGQLVGLCLPRSRDAVVAILGVLEAGAAYLPLDPGWPAARLGFMLEDAAPRLVITRGALGALGALPGAGGEVLDLEAERDALRDEAAEGPGEAPGPDDLAYVIYTSGSTGLPKGVAIRHEGAANLTQSIVRRMGVTEESRVLQYASLCFDASVFEMWLAFGAGACVVVAPSHALPDAELAGFVRRHEVTALVMTPTALAVLPCDDLPALRVVLSAGEALPFAVARRWEGPERRVWNGYGPTEATVCATLYACSGAETSAPPIGAPLCNVRVYVLDEHEAPVPVGVPGELWIGGMGVARGYLGRPELEVERFAEDPHAGKPGARRYRTGDRARFREDGALEFLGRLDDQVKVRGYRIELGEIEAVLRAHPAVAEAAATACESGGEQALAGYVVRRAEEALHLEEISDWLRARLPSYLVPGTLMEISELPKNPSGKLDRRALPAPRRAAMRQDAFAPPRDRTEELLSDVFRRVLGRERVGVHEHFFDELGASSLAVVRAAELASRELGTEIPALRLFEHPTVASLARSLRGATETASGTGGRSSADRARDRNEILRARQGKKR